jgi:hypothetical protein
MTTNEGKRTERALQRAASAERAATAAPEAAKRQHAAAGTLETEGGGTVTLSTGGIHDEVADASTVVTSGVIRRSLRAVKERATARTGSSTARATAALGQRRVRACTWTRLERVVATNRQEPGQGAHRRHRERHQRQSKQPRRDRSSCARRREPSNSRSSRGWTTSYPSPCG